MPLALPHSQLEQTEPGSILPAFLHGTQPGNFGWLSWSGSPSTPTLVASLTLPGNSQSYVNPDDPDDPAIDPGDWISGKPGVSNAQSVRDALESLRGQPVLVPAWDLARGQGEHAAYRLHALARIELIDFDLPGRNRLTVRFLGWVAPGVQNRAPMADAGPDLTLGLDQPAELQGAAYDDGLPGPTLHFQWSTLECPGPVSISEPSNLHTPVAFTTPGQHVFQLEVSDGELTTADTVTILINRPNQPPLAHPQVVHLQEDNPISLELTGTDPDLDPLAYRLILPPNHGDLTGTPPVLEYRPAADYNGSDRFSFEVSDGTLTSAPAEIQLLIEPINDPPTVDVLTLQGFEDQTLELQLSGADVEGDPLQFVIDAPPEHGALSPVDGLAGHFVYQPESDYAGPDQFTYRASDGQAWSEPASVPIDLTPVNDPPRVNAGIDLTVGPSDAIVLTGTVSDDGAPADLHLAWVKVSGPGAVHFDKPNDVLTAAAVTLPGVYTLDLIATDGEFTAGDRLVLTVRASQENLPPQVDAGPDQEIGLTARTELTGSATDDAFDSAAALTTAWSLVSGPGNATFATPDSLRTWVEFSSPGAYTVALTASDGVFSTTDTVTITAYPANLPPRVDVGPDLTHALPPQGLTSPSVGGSGRGRIVLNHDEWTFSDTGFQRAPDAGRFALNVASWLSRGRPGRFLAWSSDFGLQGTTLDRTLRLAGHEWTLTTALPFTLENLLPYDAVWLAGDVINLPVLHDYLQAGGSLYLAGGTSRTFPGGEQAYWNSFLAEYNVQFGPSYNTIRGAIPIDSGHPLLAGVQTLYFDRGNSVRIDPPDLSSATLLASHQGEGLLAWVDSGQAPLLLRSLVVDDDAPAPAAWEYLWEQLDGPTTATLSTPASPTCPVGFAIPGEYRFRLTVTQADLSSSDELTVTVVEPRLPTVDAGPDQDLTLPAQVQLHGSVGPDPAAAASITSLQWHVVSGPAPILPNPPDCLLTTVTFTQPGDYLLELAAETDEFVAADLLRIRAYLPPLPISPSLLGWWSLDGTCRDHSGTLEGALNGTSPYVPGYSQSALEFNGVDTQLQFHPASVDPAQTGTGLTVEAWIKPTEVARPQVLLAWTRDPVTPTLVLWLGADGPGSLRAEFRDPYGALRSLRTPSSLHPADPRLLVPDQFQHVALLHDPSIPQARLYRNGTLVAEAVLGPFQPRTDGLLSIGNSPHTTAPYAGLLDELAVHRRALTQEEITEIVAAGPNARVKDLQIEAGSPVTTVPGQPLPLSPHITGGARPLGEPPNLTWESLTGPAPVLFLPTDGPATSAVFDSVGDYRLRVTAADSSGTATDDLQVTVVAPETPNAPPVVSAGSDLLGWTGQPLQLAGTVTDDQLPIGSILASEWSCLSGPGIVTFTDPAAPTTAARFPTPGTYVLQLRADDGAFAVTSDTQVTVIDNQPPQVDAGPALTTSDGRLTLNATVTDDGYPAGQLTLAWSTLRGPASVQLDQPASAQTPARLTTPGSYLLRLTASDGASTASDEVVVSYQAPANAPPTANAGHDRTVLVGVFTPLPAQIADDGQPFSALEVDWTQLQGPSPAAFAYRDGSHGVTLDQPGTYLLQLSVSDGLLTATDDLVLTAVAFAPAPEVALENPLPGDFITAPIPVSGSVSSQWLQTWSLETRPAGIDAPWEPLASGGPDPQAGYLGTFDPTTLPNGAYELRLSATDALNQTTRSTPVPVVVDGALKPGRFRISFKDLTLPTAGLPLTVVRTYDSVAAQTGLKGDFGPGWSLEVQAARVVKSTDLGTGWTSLHEGAWYALDPGRLRSVIVTLADERTFTFAPILSPSLQFGYPIASIAMSFTNLGANSATLDLSGDPRADVDGYLGFVNLVDTHTFQSFNPSRFRFTSPEGLVLDLDEFAGLRSIQDPNGNRLTLTADGLVHSSGVAVQFERDDRNRIRRILDPLGHAWTYSYDDQGDLATTTDPAQQSQSFAYASQHLLTRITQPGGTTTLQNEYDAEGRLVAQLDPQDARTTLEHDIPHRREYVTDRLGHLTTHEYDDRGNIVRTVDPLGAVTLRRYDDQDHLIETIDPLALSSRHTYDPRGNLTSTSDPAGHTTRYTYDPHNRPVAVTDPLGHTTRFTYDAHGNLLSEQDPTGALTHYTYNPQGLLLAVTNALHHVTEFTYDSAGFLTQEIDALGHTTSFVRDPLGNVLQETVTRTTPTGPETLTTTFEHDPLQRITRVVFPDGSREQTSYTALGSAAQREDPLGRLTTRHYDTQDLLSGITTADGSHTSFSRDAEGRIVAVTDPLGHTRQFAYDTVGRLLAITHPDGTQETRHYDPAGRLVSTTDAAGHSAWFGHDHAGRVVAFTNALGAVTRWNYDPAGNLIENIDPLGQVTRYAWDPCGRLLQVTYPDNTTEATDYDLLGRPVRRTDAAGQTTLYGYDALGRLTSVTNPLGEVAQYRYDELGQLIAQTDPSGETVRHDYNALGERIRRTLPTGAAEHFVRDPAGRLTQHVDFNGWVTAFAYDDADRVIAHYPDPRSGEPPIEWEYNADGLRTRMTDSVGTTHYAYDALHRLVRTTTDALAFGTAGPWTCTVAYQYDPVGNLLRLETSNPNGSRVDYTYDPLNQLVAVSDAHLGRTTYDYNPAGQILRSDLPLGLATHWTYDTRGRPLRLLAEYPERVVADFQYDRTLTGHLTRLRESIAQGAGARTGERTYAYDPAGRLMEEVLTLNPQPAAPVAYAYNPAGDRLRRHSTLASLPSSTSTYAADHRLSSDLSDLQGNTLLGTAGHGLTVSCTCDARQQLTRVTSPDGTTVTFRYDGDGQRVARHVIDPQGNEITTWRVLSPLNPTGWSQVLEELEALGPLGTAPEVTAVFTWGRQLVAQDRLVQGRWTERWIGHDAHGNVRYLLNPAGESVGHLDYDAFGNLIDSALDVPLSHRFGGEWWDPLLGLYHLRARDYNPATGRFWTRDPFAGFLSDPPSLHPFNYCGADPVNASDPSGYMTLAEAQTTFTIASIIHAMTVWYGVDTLLRGQEALAQSGLAGPELYEAIEIVLYYQLLSDTVASVNVARTIPQLGRGAARLLASALSRLQRLSPKQWLHLKLWGTPPLNHQAAQAEHALLGITGGGENASFGSRALMSLPNGADRASIRLTGAGERFIHYGYAQHASAWQNGAIPGTYVGSYIGKPSAITGEQAQNLFNLPRNRRPPDCFYVISPPPGTPVLGPAKVMPAYGRDLNGLATETILIQGSPLGSVAGPYPIPVRK